MWSDISPEAVTDNSATGTVVHIIYQNNQQPPDLPIYLPNKFLINRRLKDYNFTEDSDDEEDY